MFILELRGEPCEVLLGDDDLFAIAEKGFEDAPQAPVVVAECDGAGCTDSRSGDVASEPGRVGYAAEEDRVAAEGIARCVLDARDAEGDSASAPVCALAQRSAIAGAA